MDRPRSPSGFSCDRLRVATYGDLAVSARGEWWSSAILRYGPGGGLLASLAPLALGGGGVICTSTDYPRLASRPLLRSPGGGEDQVRTAPLEVRHGDPPLLHSRRHETDARPSALTTRLLAHTTLEPCNADRGRLHTPRTLAMSSSRLRRSGSRRRERSGTSTSPTPDPSRGCFVPKASPSPHMSPSPTRRAVRLPASCDAPLAAAATRRDPLSE